MNFAIFKKQFVAIFNSAMCRNETHQEEPFESSAERQPADWNRWARGSPSL